MGNVTFWLPSPGEQISNATTGRAYTIGHRLGEGGFGAVHHCTDSTTGIDYVAKFARPEGMVADVQRRWNDECQLLSSVNSPHIIRLYDFFRFMNVFWMIMERADCTLRERIAAYGRFDERNTLHTALHLLLALTELNSKNIVHRDLHIDNILWSSRGGSYSLKVSDFGIAKQVLFAGAVATTRIGRNYDIAPDLHLNGYTTHQSDLYQVGLAMYFVNQGAEALTLADGSPKDAILSGVARARAEALGHPIGNYIAVLLRRRPQYRFQDARQALAELSNVALAYGVTF